MKVKVQYFARIRELTNQKEEVLDVAEKATVLDILTALSKRHGDKFREYIFDARTGEPKTYVQFLVNQDSISNLKGLSTVLTENSILAIIPPVGGG